MLRRKGPLGATAKRESFMNPLTKAVNESYADEKRKRVRGVPSWSRLRLESRRCREQRFREEALEVVGEDGLSYPHPGALRAARNAWYADEARLLTLESLRELVGQLWEGEEGAKMLSAIRLLAGEQTQARVAEVVGLPASTLRGRLRKLFGEAQRQGIIS